MVELLGPHRADDAKLIGHGCGVGHYLGYLSTGLAMAFELETRAKHRRIGPNEGVALPGDD